MNQWKLVPEAIDECAKPDVWNSAYAAGWNDCRKRMLAAAPAPDVQPVRWADLLKEAREIVRNAPTWKRFINGTPLSNDIAVWMADFARKYASPPPTADVEPAIYPEEAREMGLEEVPYYTHPPALPDAQELGRSERYQIQMAAISTASLGYWKEGDAISPEYDTVALRDVAKLYGRYEAVRADVAELVDVLRAIINDGMHCDVVPHLHRRAKAALAKWEGK